MEQKHHEAECPVCKEVFPFENMTRCLSCGKLLCSICECDTCYMPIDREPDGSSLTVYIQEEFSFASLSGSLFEEFDIERSVKEFLRLLESLTIGTLERLYPGCKTTIVLTAVNIDRNLTQKVTVNIPPLESMINNIYWRHRNRLWDSNLWRITKPGEPIMEDAIIPYQAAPALETLTFGTLYGDTLHDLKTLARYGIFYPRDPGDLAYRIIDEAINEYGPDAKHLTGPEEDALISGNLLKLKQTVSLLPRHMLYLLDIILWAAWKGDTVGNDAI